MVDNSKEEQFGMEDLNNFKLINNESASMNIDQKRNYIDCFKFNAKNLIKHEQFKMYFKTFFIFCLFLFITFFSHNKELENSLVGNSTEVITKGSRTYLTYKNVKKFNSYIDLCHKNILLDKNKLSLVPNPKISVTMPIYNGGKYLYYSLR